MFKALRFGSGSKKAPQLSEQALKPFENYDLLCERPFHLVLFFQYLLGRRFAHYVVWSYRRSLLASLRR